MVFLCYTTLIVNYDVLSSLDYIKFKKVNIYGGWGTGAGYEGQITQRPEYVSSYGQLIL